MLLMSLFVLFFGDSLSIKEMARLREKNLIFSFCFVSGAPDMRLVALLEVLRAGHPSFSASSSHASFFLGFLKLAAGFLDPVIAAWTGSGVFKPRFLRVAEISLACVMMCWIDVRILYGLRWGEGL